MKTTSTPLSFIPSLFKTILILGLALSTLSISAQTIIIGTGSGLNGTQTYPSPYGNWYEGAKHQMLIRATELTSAGASAGYFTSIAFEVLVANGAPLDDFTIKIKETAASDVISAFDNTGLTTVFGPQTYTDSAGWSTHVFSAPFLWDGTSNLLIESCYNNTSFTANARCWSTSTTFNSCSYYREDALGVCAQATATSVTNSRPNMQFGFTTNLNDVGVTGFTAPVSSQALTGAEAVTINVFNYGASAQDSILVFYRVDGGAPVADTIFPSLAGGASTAFTFAVNADLSTETTYIFDAWTGIVGDEDLTNDSTNGYVVVHSAPIIDAGVLGFTSPTSAINLSAAETVTIDVTNTGDLAEDTIPVAYRINGGAAVVDTVFATIAPNDTVSFTFTTLADLSTFGNYLFDAWTALPGDVDNNDDTTFNYSVDNFPVINDVGAVGFLSPQSGFNLSNSETVNVVVRNFGNVAQTSVPVSYRLDGGTVFLDTIFGTIFPGATKTMVFFLPVDLSTTGSYAFEAWTSLLTDTTTSNDSVIVSIEHYANPQPGQFMKAYGNGGDDVAITGNVTSDGGYISVGNSYIGFNYDIYAIRTDVTGDTMWTKSYDGTTHAYGTSVIQTSDGGFAILGRTYSFGVGDLEILLIKTNGDGDTLWTKSYGESDDDEGLCIQQTADGGYIISGYSRNYGAAVKDIYLIKTDSDGNTLWSKIYGGSGYEEGRIVRQTTDGGYIVTGYTSSYGEGGDDLFLLKTDGAGDSLWIRTYGGTGTDQGKDVRQTTDGGYIVTGRTSSFGGGDEVYLLKVDAIGDTIWTRIFGGNNSDPDRGYSVVQTNSGYTVVGISQSFNVSGWDVFLINTDNNGDTNWTQLYGGLGNDEIYSLSMTADGGYIMAGAVQSIFGAGNYDFFLIKTDSNGVSGSCFQQSIPALTFSTSTIQNNAPLDVADASTITLAAAPSVLFDSVIINDRTFSVTLASTDPLCANASNGTASVVSYDNFRPGADTSFAWSNGFSGGANAWDNINLAQGTYLVTVTSSGGSCMTVDSITLTDPPLLTTTISHTDVSCYFGGDGTATAQPSGGTPPYNYNWIDGQTDSTAVNLFAGTFSVNVFDVNGCVANNLVVISQPSEMAATVTGTNAICIGGNTGATSLSVTGGTLPYTYAWSNGDSIEDLSGLSAGIYSVILTDSCGAVINDTVIISEPSALVSNSSQSNISCNGATDGTTSLTIAGGTSPYTYSWSTGDSTANISGLDTGTYMVTVTDGCAIVINDSVSITEPLVLTTTVSTTDVSCNGSGDGTATVTASGGTTPYNYLWNIGQQTATAIGLFAGNYGINVFDANGCLASNNVTIIQPDVLAIQIGTTDATCNEADGVAEATVTGGTMPYVYLWSSGGSASTDSALVGGNYSLMVADTNGCNDSASVSIVITSPVQEICIITVDSTSTRNVVVWEKPVVTNIDSFRIYRDIIGTYTWVGSLPYGIESYFTDSTNGVNPMTTSYRYKVTTLDACGNESVMGDYHETIHVQTTNNGSTVDLLWDNYEGFNFGYYRILRDSTGLGGANWVAIDSVTNSNFTFTDINPPTIGASYIVEVVADAVCEAKKQKNFNSSKSNTSSVGSIATMTGTIASTDAGQGLCDGTASVTAAGGVTPYAYAWDGGTNFQMTETAVGLCAGMYSVTVTDALGDTLVLSVAVGQTQGSALVGTTSATESSADTCNGTATVTATGGTGTYTYLWDGNAGSQSTATAVGLCPGTYSVTVIDSVGNEIVVFANVGTLPGILEFNKENEAISVYPNPYKGETRIAYTLTNESQVVVEIFNMIGEHVITLADESQATGEHSYKFSAAAMGESMGVYLVVITVSGERYTKRIVEIR